jgi:peptide/nickel transport system ATP-binding protein
MADLLTVNNLKVYLEVDGGTVKAADGVSFRIVQGKTTALVGESGSGKSIVAQSIMRILPKVARIVDGSILFADPEQGGGVVDIARLDPWGAPIRAIRGGRISIIFQEPMTALSPLHTIGNQIGETLALHRDMDKLQREDAVVETLRLVGFPDPKRAVSKYPFELSGGLRQRAMIAMALICRPTLLIADEPTTALDVTIQAQILQLIKGLQRDLDMSMLMITHDLGVVANMADEVVVMYHGKVVESGPVEAIFRSPGHAYLKALMRAVPRFDMAPGERLTPLREIQVKAGHMLMERGPGKAADAGEAPLLEVKNLTKSFGTRAASWLGGKAAERVLAVDDVSFFVRRGECLGLVGESGCGKTTTAKMIMRSITPDSGQITFNDGGVVQDVLALKGKELIEFRSKAQFVFQDPVGSLNPRMNALEILSEPLTIHNIGTPESRVERVKELMELVGLKVRHLRRYPHSFSGGQRQRLGIARALALSPRLLICDEPVSALDVSVQAQVLNLMRDLREALGLTYIFVSHNLAVVHYVADRIAVMCAGKMVETAETGELFRNPMHPYTKALLAAVPVPDLDAPMNLAALMDGKASVPADWPEPYRLGRGEQSRMIDLGKGHFIRARESINSSELVA